MPDRDDPDARLHDAYVAARAREHTADETRSWRDELRFWLSLSAVIRALRRQDKQRGEGT